MNPKSSIAIIAALALSTTAALAVTFTNDTTIAIGVTTYDGQDILVSNCTLTVNGPHPFNSLLVASNGVVTETADPAGTTSNRLELTILTDATVALGGAIQADGQGYGAQQGPGAGGTVSCDWFAGGGGGHGGFGGAGNDGCYSVPGGAVYGSVLQPVTFGSGGGWAGGAGGGAIRLNVGGTLTVEGQIRANGLPAAWGYGGGGAGGSIWLTVGTLAGTGSIMVNGGPSVAADGGGAAGGRIAIYYTNNLFAGTLSAHGAPGNEGGGAGTVYTKHSGDAVGSLLLDNGGTVGVLTPLTAPEPFALTIGGQALVYPETNLTLRSLVVASNGTLLHLASQSGLALAIQQDATVALGGAIQTDGEGYGANQGPGAGGSLSCDWNAGGGGGHGGLGGAGSDGCASVPGGAAYGSVLQPVTFGSGGGWAGGAGGGAICLNVGGTLTVEGTLSANGLPAAWGYGGGGAGGSLWLTAGTLAGTGVISASGGPSVAADGGGGAGGRIAIYYTNNLFAGTLSAHGAPGNEGGGAGAVYTKHSGDAVGSLLLDNGGTVGVLTPLTAPEPFALTIGGQALVYPETNLTLRSLVVASNGTLLHLASQSGLALAIQQDATVALGGAIQADGQGYGANQGPGAGGTVSCDWFAGGGGGHGGLGGAGSDGCASVPGGAAYGSVLQPVTFGSGGGWGGGAGGGAICLNVGGTLTVEGTLSANGLSAAWGQGGGGAGGSVWLAVGTLAGTGVISANGGPSVAADGGGGAGGRIAIYYTNNLFAGTLSALGATGCQNGGAGTIYTKAATQATGQVLVYNLGTNAAMTPLTAPEPFSLTITGSATAFPQTALILGNLRLATNTTLTHLLTQSSMDLTVLQDVTVDAGGTIQADGQGYGANQGPGAGGTLSCDWFAGGGGGHGGLGGAGSDGCASVPGGAAYGSVLQPMTEGSGGGWGGGAGGGAIRLNVGGTLTVEGQIRANGLPAAWGQGGGGAGGSIWLTVGSLAGAGVISANGGPSVSAYGGGGAGGRVAIYATNTSGNVMNHLDFNGADGCQPGALGTLQLQSGYPPLQAIGFAPASAVMSAVSNVDVFFNIAANPTTVLPADVAITTPGGPIPASQITVEMLGGTQLRLGFPPQNVPGAYQVQVGPQIEDLYGNPMTQAYGAAFLIAAPLISGAVCDTNGLPVAGVALQPDGGLSAVLTAANGHYSLPVLASWTGTVTPSKPGWMFVPGVLAYTNLTANVTNQNYTLVENIAPALSSRQQGAGCHVQWYGLGGLGYQPQSSTNLVNWADYGSLQNGTNGPLWFDVPITSAPQMFFRLQLLGN